MNTCLFRYVFKDVQRLANGCKFILWLVLSALWIQAVRAQSLPALGWTLCQPAASVRSVAAAEAGYFISARLNLECNLPTSFSLVKHSYDGAVWWTRTFSDPQKDLIILSVDCFADGSVVAVAYESLPGDSCYYLIMKTNPQGDTLWTRRIFFAASGSPPAAEIIALSDGGILLAGTALTDNQWDVLLLRWDGSGNLLWQKIYGGTEDDYATGVAEAADGFYVTATTASADGDVSGQHGLTDVWVIKTDGAGTIVWKKCFGGSGYDQSRTIRPLSDGNWILCCNSTSNDGDVSGHHGSAVWYDYWIVKMSPSGTLLWQKSLGGSHYDLAAAAAPVNDTTLVVAGSSYSTDGDVQDHYGSQWYADFWIAALNLNGSLLWSKSYGGTSYDIAASMTVLDGGWVITAGNTLSTDGNVGTGCVKDSCYQMPAGWLVKFHAQCASPPISIFSYTNQGPSLIKFLNGSQNAASYLWDFGDGTTGTGKNPLHQYYINQNVAVCLTASNACTYDLSCQLVSTCSALQPDFTVQTSGLTVTFQQNTPMLASAEWSFGDGNTSNALQPVHTYLSPGNYPVTLTAYDSCGKAYSVVKTISTCNALQAAFSYSSDNNQVAFQDLSQGNPNTWLWSFGDGNSSVAQHPVHTYSTGTAFTVCLTVGHTNCPDITSTTCQQIGTCASSASAGFSVSSHDNKITFSNQSSNAFGYFWDFGDGSYSSDANPVHDYPPGLGIYNACLVAYDSCGSDTFCTKLYMGLGPVTANFLYTVFGLNVVFTNISTNAVSYFWDFGDGNTSTVMHPFHTYAADGVYNVCLIAWDVLGNTDTFCQNVSTCLDIEPDFSYTASDLTVSFNDLTTGSVQWLWDFGDGIFSSFQHPTHTYAANGTYTVCLIATNACGLSDTLCKTIKVCSQLNSQFNYSTDYLNVQFTDQTSGSTSWFWAFGNGGYSFLQNPSVSYNAAGTYNVCLTTSNVCGKYHTTCQPVTVCAPVVAAFNWSANFLTVSFSNQTPATTQWQWSFGDGNSSSLENPTHTYNANGTYTVTLIATNLCGYSDTVQKTITVCAPLTASFSEQANLLTVSFTPAAPNAVSYVWYLGDGTISFASQPTHTYSAPGNYAVCLVVSDLCNNAFQYCKTITVCTTLNAAFSASSFYLTTFFTDLSDYPVSWNWTFGDGNSSSTKNPMHTYGANGVYTACLVATDACGKQDTACQQITVCSPITASFSYVENYLEVAFTSATPTAVAWFWDFGDGMTSSLSHPVHTYEENGTYDVCLVVTDLCGRKDTMCQQITVCAPLAAGFSWTANLLTVKFTNLTPNTLQWFWDFGDGNISTLENPVHTFPAMGAYPVCLIVFDLCTSDTICQEVLITCPPFAAGFTYQISNFTVSFFDQSANSIGWQWDFGDGSSSTQKNPVHTYADTGQYTVCLVSRDSCSSDTLCKTLTILLSGSAPVGSVGDLLLFPNPASDVAYVQWTGEKPAQAALFVYDAVGRCLLNRQSAEGAALSFTLPVSQWPPGAYLVVVQVGNQQWLRKLIVP